MNITLISRYFDTRNAGAGSHSKLIYEGLSKKENINVKQLSQKNSIIPTYNKLAYLFYSSVDLKRLINKNEYKNTDVFHALSSLESLYLPKRRSVASVLDLIPLMEKNSFFAKFFNKSIESTVKCEMIIVNNSDIKKELISNYSADSNNIEVIPPPIDSAYYPIKKDNDVFTVGTISNLMKRKRVDILVKSFLEADIENSRLLIGGNGLELENLKKLAKNDKRIEFLGFVSDKEMNTFYNSLDVFVFPSLVEGYGMPIVEAMACGKPVITLEDSYIPLDLKNKTFVTNKKNLANILKNREFNCNIKKNIEFYKEHSNAKVASKLINVYNTFL